MGSLEGIEIQAATIQVSVERKIPYFAFFGSCFQFPVFLFDGLGWKTKGDERLKRGKARENHLEGLNSFLLCTGYALPITWVGTRLVTPTQHWRGSTSLLHEPSPPLTFPKSTGFGVKGCVCIYVQYINVIALYKAGNICVRYMKPQHDSNIPDLHCMLGNQPPLQTYLFSSSLSLVLCHWCMWWMIKSFMLTRWA